MILQTSVNGANGDERHGRQSREGSGRAQRELPRYKAGHKSRRIRQAFLVEGVEALVPNAYF